jgi:hypothetical protein
MSDRSFTYTDGQYRTPMQRRLLKAASEMMHLTRWTELSGLSIAADRYRDVDPLQPPVPFGNTNILDRVLVDLTDPQYFSRWRILDYSLGPCGTAILAT